MYRSCVSIFKSLAKISVRSIVAKTLTPAERFVAETVFVGIKAVIGVCEDIYKASQSYKEFKENAKRSGYRKAAAAFCETTADNLMAQGVEVSSKEALTNGLREVAEDVKKFCFEKFMDAIKRHGWKKELFEELDGEVGRLAEAAVKALSYPLEMVLKNLMISGVIVGLRGAAECLQEWQKSRGWIAGVAAGAVAGTVATAVLGPAGGFAVGVSIANLFNSWYSG